MFCCRFNSTTVLSRSCYTGTTLWASFQLPSRCSPLTISKCVKKINGVFTRSSKRPANFQQMYSKYTC